MKPMRCKCCVVRPLPRRRKEVLTLDYNGELLTYEQLAERIGISYSAAVNRVCHGRCLKAGPGEGRVARERGVVAVSDAVIRGLANRFNTRPAP